MTNEAAGNGLLSVGIEKKDRSRLKIKVQERKGLMLDSRFFPELSDALNPEETCNRNT